MPLLIGGDAPAGLAFGTAMMFVMFAYSGWNASAYIAGELKEPRRTLPLSLLAGTGIVIALYLAVNLFILLTVPFQELKGMEEAVKEASIRAFGSGTGNLLGYFVALALLSSLSAYIILGPRVYYAMAQDRLFLPIAAKIHPRYGVPGISILIQGLIAILMVITGTLDQIMYYVGICPGRFPLAGGHRVVPGPQAAHRRTAGRQGLGVSGRAGVLPDQQPRTHGHCLSRPSQGFDHRADFHRSRHTLLLPLGQRIQQEVMPARDTALCRDPSREGF